METRQQSCKVIKIWHCGETFKSIKEFAKGKLPTIKNVLCRMLNEEKFLKREGATKVATELRDLWIWCNVYPISEQRIIDKICNLMKEFSAIDRYPKQKRKDTFMKKEEEFISKIDKIFDIFCNDLSKRRDLEKFYKLQMTEEDYKFYDDQKSQRLSVCLDKQESLTASDLRFRKRHALDAVFFPPVVITGKSDDLDAMDDQTNTSESEAESISTSSCSSLRFSSEYPCASSDQNRCSWPNLSLMCERFQLSDRAGAAVANAVIKDLQEIVQLPDSLLVDRSKLRRERKKFRNETLLKDEKFLPEINAIYTDGRKDATLVQEQSKRKVVTEEHYVVIGEPGTFYLTHVTPENGKGRVIANAIYQYIKDNSMENNIYLIGTDGTAVMTGANNGFIRSLEELLDKPLHWVVCLLHLNELPLRHVFASIDGPTVSADSFAGPIGKKLKGAVSEWKVAKFESIPNSQFPVLPITVVEDLSSDQYYAYKICIAVMSGNLDSDLAQLEIGPMIHSRWLTLACRILRYYTAQEKPSANLKILAKFCVTVYFPTWFQIKLYNKITDGPKNFFDAMQRIKNFPDENIQAISIKVLQRNAFFSHPENVLLAMLADGDENVRKSAVDDIRLFRSMSKSGSTKHLRHFEVPTINVNAKVYYEMIELSREHTTEPPLLQNMPMSQVEEFISTPLQLSHPCHNQQVERHVKLVTEACKSVTGFENRDGIIRQRIRSRQMMKKFDTKCQFDC